MACKFFFSVAFLMVLKITVDNILNIAETKFIFIFNDKILNMQFLFFQMPVCEIKVSALTSLTVDGKVTGFTTENRCVCVSLRIITFSI